MCGCPRDHLCALCFQGAWDNLRGCAATRGEVWADDVARRVRARERLRPWPPHTARAADLARGKVDDLTRDPRLVEVRAAELARWASRRWGATLAPDAHAPA
jgi:hypothetical protein